LLSKFLKTLMSKRNAVCPNFCLSGCCIVLALIW
jgi:hypothetical protein